MIRVTVRLHEDEYVRATKEANSLGLSVAEFLRQSVRDELPVSNDAPWMRFAGMFASGDPNSSRSIDEIVYGSKERV